MNVIDIILYVFNGITNLNFDIMSLSDLSTFVSNISYWGQLLDVSFIISLVIYLSIFFFVWKVTYQLFFRLFMFICHFPKRWKNK